MKERNGREIVITIASLVGGSGGVDVLIAVWTHTQLRHFRRKLFPTMGLWLGACLRVAITQSHVLCDWTLPVVQYIIPISSRATIYLLSTSRLSGDSVAEKRAKTLIHQIP